MLLLTNLIEKEAFGALSRKVPNNTGGMHHEIRPIRMRHLWSDFRAWKEPFAEVYVVKFSLYSKLV